MISKYESSFDPKVAKIILAMGGETTYDLKSIERACQRHHGEIELWVAPVFPDPEPEPRHQDLCIERDAPILWAYKYYGRRE